MSDLTDKELDILSDIESDRQEELAELEERRNNEWPSAPEE